MLATSASTRRERRPGTGGAGPVRCWPCSARRSSRRCRRPVGDLLVAARAACRGSGTCCRWSPSSCWAPRPGLFTAWVERKFIGAAGRRVRPSRSVERLPDRGAGDLVLSGQALLAGQTWSSSTRAGRSSQAVWWQYLFPLAAAALLLALWPIRRRTRAPLAAAVVFRRNALPGAGFFQRLSVPLFLCGRPFPILGEPGDHYACSRQAWPCCWSVQRAG